MLLSTTFPTFCRYYLLQKRSELLGAAPSPLKQRCAAYGGKQKESNIPTLKNIEQEDTQGTTGCFFSCGIQRRKVSIDDLLSFTATLKFSCFLYILYILQQNPGNSNSEGKPKTVELSRSIEQSISCVNKIKNS